MSQIPGTRCPRPSGSLPHARCVLPSAGATVGAGLHEPAEGQRPAASGQHRGRSLGEPGPGHPGRCSWRRGALGLPPAPMRCRRRRGAARSGVCRRHAPRWRCRRARRSASCVLGPAAQQSGVARVGTWARPVAGTSRRGRQESDGQGCPSSFTAICRPLPCGQRRLRSHCSPWHGDSILNRSSPIYAARRRPGL